MDKKVHKYYDEASIETRADRKQGPPVLTDCS